MSEHAHMFAFMYTHTHTHYYKNLHVEYTIKYLQTYNKKLLSFLRKS